MLSRLSIRSFAIVDQLDVEWSSGLNVITGETGAGKSILVDAVGALLGDRLGPEVVRSGAARAVIEGVFVLPAEPGPGLAAVLDAYGLEPEDGALIVTREIAGAGGRGAGRVNGRTVPLSVLEALGEQLVDVHGQSQHMALLRVREHLDYLDRYAGLLGERAGVADLVRSVRQVHEELSELAAAERQALREQEMLRHEVAEIERAALREDEEKELEALRTRLRHVERIREAATSAYRALAGDDTMEIERPGATELLGSAAADARLASAVDARLAPHAEALDTALVAAEEVARELRSYLDELDDEPASLEQAEERHVLLADLKRKYGASVAEILAYHTHASARLARFETREERRTELVARDSELLATLGEAAGRLSRDRAEAGQRLAAAVEAELGDLAMGGTRFGVAVTQRPVAEGVAVDGQVLEFDATGVDRVELLIAPNRGEELKPLQKVASGGELARIALALKTILSRADTRATLIFDEVDSGVGGRTAPIVGEKLWSLASGGHQVLCVTHMPQIAAYADQHWVVAKQVDGDSTRTQIKALTSDEQEEELALMLAGSATPSARDSARELVAKAAAARHQSAAPSRSGPARRA